MDDLYKRLGVSRRATQKEIRSAYRRLARNLHPDVSQSPDGAAQFTKIHEAYRILIDPERRARYDRGEPVTPRPVTFYAAHRQQVIAYERKINRVIDEMLEHERQETRAREQVVWVVVTLFMSTFIVALAKPLFVDLWNWPALLLVGALSGVSLWYLVRTLAAALERYTYRPRPPSVTHPIDPPPQPFTRGMGLAFLAVGYLASVCAGALVDALSGGLIGGGLFGGHSFLGLLLYPPIAVMIVDNMRRLGNVIDPFQAGP
jgi:hypothetical protein